MQLTKHTDYAFRTLIYLASVPEGKLTSIKHICEYYDISPNHLSKVVLKLVNLGYVKSVRGKGGGICLAQLPAAIYLRDVLQAVEPELNPVNCNEPPCRISPNCRLKQVLGGAMAAFLASMDGMTLADIVVDQLDTQVITIQ